MGNQHLEENENKILRARLEELEKELVRTRSERIKDARRAEEELQRAKRKYHSILESITEGFISMDREWRYSIVNEQAGKLLGKRKEELLGRVDWEVFPGSTTYVTNELDRCMKQNLPVHFEGYNEQSKRWYESHCYPSSEGIWIFFQDITERKRSEVALRASEQRLQLAIESIKLGTWDCDPITKELFWSERCKELFGLPADAHVDYQTFLDRLHPDDRDRIHEAVQQALDPDGSGSYSVEYRTRWPDGAERWIMAGGRALFEIIEGERRAVRFVGINLDISERRRMEDKLRRAEEHFRLTFDQSPIGAFLGGTNFGLLRVNAEFCRFLGYSEDELLTLAFPDITHPDDGAIAIAGVRRLIAGEIDSFNIIKRYVRKGGGIVWGRAFIRPVRDCEGHLLYLLGMVVDISERKQVEEALIESEERFRLIADTMPSLVWTTQQDGTVDYANRRSLEYLGNPPGDGEKWEFSVTEPKSWPVHPEDLAPSIDAWRRALQTGEPYEMEHRLRRFDLSYRWHLCRATPVRDGHGKILRWYAQATDIHEIREARRELERKVEERTAELRDRTQSLEEANTALKVLLNRREQDKKEFTESVVMNVRNLIEPYIETIRRTDLSNRQMTLLNVIESQIRDLTSPFSKTLAFQHINLTPTEMRIAAHIKDGKSTEKIADILSISEKTVWRHRDNIREKLGLRGGRKKLRSYLLNLS
ncbi:hypothetical protein SBDP1_1040019 [Syntrophobacter sp. SbD1]|nr:hypothetical protein SBDP1_1040019 [Syntrophobacter sp. SbD1]